jgi:predicted ATP-grasp superfamily ATP-dependent carboligase
MAAKVNRRLALEMNDPQSQQWLPRYSEISKKAGQVVASVFGAETFNGLGVIRGLGRMGVPVYAMGQEKNSIGFYSRYASERIIYSDPHHGVEKFIATLIDLGKKLKAENKRAMLFPTSDRVVQTFSKNEKILSEYFILNLPGPEILANCLDKQAQYRLARELDIPFPHTYIETEIPQLFADLANGRIEYPILLKARQALPAHLRRKFRTAVLKNKSELEATLKSIASEKISFVIQEIIPGEDDALYTFGSYMNPNGESKAIFTGRKLRQQPPHFGICRVGESKFVEQIIGDSEKLLRGLKFFGISQTEYKYDCRDGRYKLMEVNPRSWAWIGLPIAMGINLPYVAFCDALGIEIPAQKMQSRRAVWISLGDDLFWCLKNGDCLPWRHCFGYEQIVEAYFSSDDLKPGLVQAKRSAIEISKMCVGKAVKYFRRPKLDEVGK